MMGYILNERASWRKWREKDISVSSVSYGTHMGGELHSYYYLFSILFLFKKDIWKPGMSVVVVDVDANKGNKAGG